MIGFIRRNRYHFAKKKHWKTEKCDSKFNSLVLFYTCITTTLDFRQEKTVSTAKMTFRLVLHFFWWSIWNWGDRKKKEWNDLWWFSVPVVEISVFNLFSKNKTRSTTAPSSVNLFRPWKCALLSPRIAGRWGIRPFACHRLCKYTCVHTLASHNPLDCPCKFYTTQNRSWLLYLKSKRRIINYVQ